jgi:hypothetical protein
MMHLLPQHFDHNGKEIHGGSMTVEIIGFGVLFEGKVLERSNGPHTVPRGFGMELVVSGRAREI